MNIRSLLTLLATFLVTSSAHAAKPHQLVCDFADDPNLHIGITLNGPTRNTEIDPSSVARVIITRTSRSGTETVLSDTSGVRVQKITLVFPGTTQESVKELSLISGSFGRLQWLNLTADEEEGQMTLRSSMSELPAAQNGANVSCEYRLLHPRPALSGGNR